MFEYWDYTDVSVLPTVKQIPVVFHADSGANMIGVHVFDNGDALSLSGTVEAWIIRADNETLKVAGEKSGNDAWVILPASAYTVPGRLGIYLKLKNGTEVITLAAYETSVHK